MSGAGDCPERLRTRSSRVTFFTPVFVELRTTDTNSCPGAATDESVPDHVHAAGSDCPSSQVRNITCWPTTRKRSHCLAVVTRDPAGSERSVEVTPPTFLLTTTAPEFDTSCNP